MDGAGTPRRRLENRGASGEGFAGGGTTFGGRARFLARDLGDGCWEEGVAVHIYLKPNGPNTSLVVQLPSERGPLQQN